MTETFEVKPHFEWVKFRLSYNQFVMYSTVMTQVLIDYLMWKGAQR